MKTLFKQIAKLKEYDESLMIELSLSYVRHEIRITHATGLEVFAMKDRAEKIADELRAFRKTIQCRNKCLNIN